MTEQTIPAEKVRELIEHFEGKDIGIESYGIIGRFRALLPAQQPTSGLLGRWAKHPEHGDVVCVWDEPMEGHITVHYRYKDERTGTLYDQVPLDSLTFPHQATKPEEVPAGEAWLVDVNATHFKAEKATGFRDEDGGWLIVHVEKESEIAWDDCYDKHITLISPLTPERPRKDDLQAKYDVMEDKYREASEGIEVLSQDGTPCTVTTKAEYIALPEGSVAAQPGELDVYIKNDFGGWDRLNTTASFPNADLAGTTRTVLRYGWGDEQPAWRIEHRSDNLCVGEYIIDIDGDDGAVTHEWRGRWDTDGDAYGAPPFAPFIVFPNKDAATPEAILEAKKARDKEMGK